MSDQPKTLEVPTIAPLIRIVRGVRVILDADLAKLYGVETRALTRPLSATRSGSRTISPLN